MRQDLQLLWDRKRVRPSQTTESPCAIDAMPAMGMQYNAGLHRPHLDPFPREIVTSEARERKVDGPKESNLGVSWDSSLGISHSHATLATLLSESRGTIQPMTSRSADSPKSKKAKGIILAGEAGATSQPPS